MSGKHKVSYKSGMEQRDFIDELERLRERLNSFIQPTPLKQLEEGLWAKCEYEQPTGSFKIRPAFNSILSKLSEARSRGVVAASSGNFAQAIAYASRELGVKSQIVMLSTTSKLKIQKTKELGAEVILCGEKFEDRAKMLDEISNRTSAIRAHPFDSWETILGDSSLGLEILDETSDVFDLWVPASGGGLVAGLSYTLKHFEPAHRIFACQPENNSCLSGSILAGKPVTVDRVESLADALIATRPGKLTFPIIQRHVSACYDVSEEEIVAALKSLWAKYAIKVEPASAVAYAAYSKYAEFYPKRKHLLILTGCNIDEKLWMKLISGS
ncbi:MAG: hypothetical protein COV44_09775 [Deltaproteobacteria bacterium CG11_big_fil_rev_8_21_14_0_20_45_16]|nr:MAG: hypothetical protein COV44_09775 [Deltaproteobacteria bacterium CG11_big_fil_rev_8_21_14_0_20_45_16]